MFTCLFNCLLSFKHFLNMFYSSFGMDIFHMLWRHLVTKLHLTLMACQEYHLMFAFWVFTQLYYVVGMLIQ